MIYLSLSLSIYIYDDEQITPYQQNSKALHDWGSKSGSSPNHASRKPKAEKVTHDKTPHRGRTAEGVTGRTFLMFPGLA